MSPSRYAFACCDGLLRVYRLSPPSRGETRGDLAARRVQRPCTPTVAITRGIGSGGEEADHLMGTLYDAGDAARRPGHSAGRHLLGRTRGPTTAGSAELSHLLAPACRRCGLSRRPQV